MKNILPLPCYTEDIVSDRLTWTAFRQGNAEAFGRLYYQYFNMLFYKSYTICTDKEMIKDCIHDLFAGIWKNRSRLATPGSVKAYLLSSVQRKLVRSLRQKHIREKRLHMIDITAVHSAEEKMITEQFGLQRRRRMVRAIEKLTKRQQQALLLRFYADLSYPEIADKMKISKKAVYNLVAKAISNLQLELHK